MTLAHIAGLPIEEALLTEDVVSSTLTDPTRQNSTVVGGYDADVLRDLKAQTEGNLYVSGSGTLVRAMLADGLVDELHLFVYPTTRGTGPRLFPEGAAPSNLGLAASETYENGVVYLAHGPRPTADGRRPTADE